MPLHVDWALLRVGNSYAFSIGATVKVPPLAGAEFIVVRQLGAGTYGETYALSASAREAPRFVLKLFKPQPNDDAALSGLRYDVAREYAIGDYLYRRIGPWFCANARGGACAIARWLDAQQRTGYILFPYVNSLSVRQFTDMLYANKFAQLPAHSVASFIVLAHIAVNLLDALAQMHAIGLYHNDLSPDNALVASDRERGARAFLIDFGLSCAETSSEAALQMLASYGVDKRVVYCYFLGAVNQLYGDPARAAYESRMSDARSDGPGEPGENLLDTEYWRYDVYSAGVVVNYLFTPTFERRGVGPAVQSAIKRRQQVFPLFEPSQRLPIGLRELIAEMTSARLADRRRAKVYATFFRQMIAQLSGRQPLLADDFVPGVLPDRATETSPSTPNGDSGGSSVDEDDEFFLPKFAAVLE